MKYIFLFLFFFPIHSFAFNDIGVVTLTYNGGLEEEVKIYKSATDTIPFAITHWDYELDSIIPSYDTYSGTSIISYFCMGESKNRYCIRRLTLPIQSYWIEKKSFIQFTTWEDWWNDGEESYIGESDTIRNGPDDHSKEIKNPCECHILSIDSLSGEWVKVIFSDVCVDDKGVECSLTKMKTPLWIRWRRGDSIFLYPYRAE